MSSTSTASPPAEAEPDAPAPRRRSRRDLGGDLLRVLLLGSLAAAPLGFGAVHEPVFVPLLALWALLGLVAWWRTWRKGRSWSVPGGRLLLVWHLLIAVQLLPLPPPLLACLSPGSFAYYDGLSLVPLSAWRPVSVNPADTARGLAFLAAMTLLYMAVLMEFGHDRWRRRLCRSVVAVGGALTVVALLQAASLQPRRIYGLWQPQWDWAVFGPYVSKNHFAGYLVMAIPLGLGLALESLHVFHQEWAGRRTRWLALGSPAGTAAIRSLTMALLLVVGLLASRSRGGLFGFACAAAALPILVPRRRQITAVVIVICLAAAVWVGLGATVDAFATRGLQGSRIGLWTDALRMLRPFPVLGHGFNAFGTAYAQYQTFNKADWYGEAHNDYLQVVLETGLAGATVVILLLLQLFQRGLRASRLSPLDAGVLAALLGLCAHNVVDFNWQVPANAATFVALAAVAVSRGDTLRSGWKGIALTPRKGGPRIALPRGAAVPSEGGPGGLDQRR